MALGPEEQAAGHLMPPFNRRRQLDPPFPKHQPNKRRQPGKLIPSPYQTGVPLTTVRYAQHHHQGWLMKVTPKQPGKVFYFPAGRRPHTHTLPLRDILVPLEEIPSTPSDSMRLYQIETKITQETFWKSYCHWSKPIQMYTRTCVLNINRVSAC